MAVTTVASIVGEIERFVYGHERPLLNKLDAAVSTTSQTTVTLEYATDNQFGQGAFLAVDDELVYVWSVDHATKVATVERGLRNTVAATHVDGTLVEINPRFPKAFIKNAVVDEIRSWPSKLYQVTKIGPFTAGSTRRFDIGAQAPDLLGIIDIQTSDDIGLPRVKVAKLVRGADTSVFPSGVGVVVDRQYDNDIWMTVARPFDIPLVVASGTPIEAFGLSETVVPAAVYGAAARLVAGREIGRLDPSRQAEPRRADEVPAGAHTSMFRVLMAARSDAIENEARRLLSTHPVRWS